MTLIISDLKYNWSLWKHGFSPVYKSKIQTNNKWKLLDGDVKVILKNKKL